MRVFLMRFKAPGCSRGNDHVSGRFPRKPFTFNMILWAKVDTAVPTALSLDITASKLLPLSVFSSTRATCHGVVIPRIVSNSVVSCISLQAVGRIVIRR